ncbi:glycosyltransferase family 4 protein [Prosthecomicrobium sp. N25]|uniref:glycosyltransferase family 4 protein n=1 Tax=Prosthecomicrobium sp. N25 TaxID=3129254 RepID=UPI00307877DB
MTGAPETICFPFIGDEIGGSHISAMKLIKHLDRDRFRPLIALHDASSALADLLRRNGLDFVEAPAVPYLKAGGSAGARLRSAAAFLMRSVPLCRAFLKRHDVRIVHTNDGQMHATWGLAARAAGASLLWHHRGDPDARGVNMLAPILANHIVTVSKFARPQKPVLGVDGRLSVVHSPFDHAVTIPDRARSRAMIADAIGCAPDTRFLGYFGLLIDRKRPVAFVDAVHAVIRRHPELPVAGLLFGVPALGGPALDEAVRARAEELGIADRIQLMGFRQPVDPWMGGVDALLVPAVREPFGRTLIEAMLLGTPVVATDHGGNTEAIDHGRTGFLVAVDDAEAFVEPVHALLTDPALWSRISETAQREALSSYSVETHVSRISEIYAHLLDAKTG